jgi:hypothetical protein
VVVLVARVSTMAICVNPLLKLFIYKRESHRRQVAQIVVDSRNLLLVLKDWSLS